MDKKRMNIIWGALIVFFGVLLLLITTDVIDIRVNTAWAFGVLFFFGFLILSAYIFQCTEHNSGL